MPADLSHDTYPAINFESSDDVYINMINFEEGLIGRVP